MENQQSLTHWKKLTNPDYLGAYSLQPGEERTVEIINVVRKMVKGPDGKQEECTVANLRNEKPFILNVTNCKTLSRIYGTPYIEHWCGKQVIVYAAKVKAFGEEMEALRIKNTLPPLPELYPDHPQWKGAIKALSDGTVDMHRILSRFSITEENKALLNNESTQSA